LPLHGNVHLHGRRRRAFEHHPLAAADLEDATASFTVDASEHFRAVQPVEIADDAGHLRVVALDVRHVFVEIAFAQLTQSDGRHHSEPVVQAFEPAFCRNS
jgi:hypothetical protein